MQKEKTPAGELVFTCILEADLQGFDGGRSPNEREHRRPQVEKRRATSK